MITENCDVVVVGAGHAGCEAALACARRGLAVVVVTPNLDRIGWMSCNPSIGGVGKGHLVREVDVLGGEMGRNADRSTIHARTLNASKGPAVRSTRVQTDMYLYSRLMAQVLDQTPGLMVRQGLVEELLVATVAGVDTVIGVRTALQERIEARAVVITTGTFLSALMHVGDVTAQGGRAGEPAAVGLSDSLRQLGLPLMRLKTGTCPRLDSRSLDLTQLEEQPTEPETRPFSLACSLDQLERPQRTVSCHITYTTERTHDIIRQAQGRSPLFTGKIEGRGPRYCPSIEDKVIRFPDKSRHQVFIEPEGLDTNEVYPSGLSTSLPADVQLDLLRSIPGMERAQVRRWGYAVEYDFVPPTELWPSLECKRIKQLFLAGQINGTSGYEEAAAQGLLAGINAAQSLGGDPPMILLRDEAYCAVMIDDLVTKGTDEPYRMFTSRAEHRLLLREDNTVVRLLQRAQQAGLSPSRRLRYMEQLVTARQRLTEICQRETVAIDPSINTLLVEVGSTPLQKPTTIAQLLRRPELSLRHIRQLVPTLLGDCGDELLRGVVTDLRYAGYIEHARQSRQLEAELSAEILPADLRYQDIAGLSNEMREKLERVRPTTLAQASRIPGVTSAALGCLAVELKHRSESQS